MRVPLTAFVATAAVFAAITVPTEAKAPFNRIVVFGTSLSDSGNAFALRGGTNNPHDFEFDPLLVPAVPYTRGGHHLSNGATWIEQFARSRGLAGTVRPAFASQGEGTNYAVAAARAREDNQNLNFSAQVDAFLNDVGSAAPPDALYVIDMGGNDVRDALVAYLGGGPLAAAAVLEQANVAIAQNIQRLYVAGARNFLVWRVPNIGLTPALRRLDVMSPGATTLAAGLTVAFNDGLDEVVGQSSALPGISIVRLDAFQLIDAIVASPANFGLSNVTAACVTTIAPFHCDRPDEFLFWDGIHPTAAGHAILAKEAARVLGQ